MVAGTEPGLIPVLYEDEVLLVLNKPAGLVVHPGSGTTEPTMIDLLEQAKPELADIERIGLVHRLDKGTSGVVLVAKTAEAKEALSKQFSGRSVEKTYQALVNGIPKNSEGVIDAPVTRHHADRTKMTVRPDGRPAETRYRVVSQHGDKALLELKPKTGRTHQIRVHLAALGHPIVGDATYGSADPDLDRPFLHAAKLAVTHPATGKPFSIGAGLPKELRQYLEQLDG